MSSDTTYQNISAEHAEVRDRKSTTIGPEGIYFTPSRTQQVDGENLDTHRTYYNTAAEYAPIDEEESGTVAADNAHVIQRPDENTGTDGSDTAKVPVNDAPPNQQTVNEDTLPDDMRKQSTKKSQKAPSFYDDEMYSMVGPDDKASSNGSPDDKASFPQSLSKKKRPKKKMKACLKYGIPTAMVFLTTVVVAVTLRHFGMFPNIIDMIIPGR